jgi:hypothetical protein
MSLATLVLPGSLEVERLEAALIAGERLYGTLVGLEAEDSSTVATFDPSRSVPPGALIVGITGPAFPPTGATLVLNGHAIVADSLAPVSVGRWTPKEHEFGDDDFAVPDSADEDMFGLGDEDGYDIGFITGPARP